MSGKVLTSSNKIHASYPGCFWPPKALSGIDLVMGQGPARTPAQPHMFGGGLIQPITQCLHPIQPNLLSNKALVLSWPILNPQVGSSRLKQISPMGNFPFGPVISAGDKFEAARPCSFFIGKNISNHEHFVLSHSIFIQHII